jgi:DNA-directed RNA polymerase II subunit RPB2
MESGDGMVRAVAIPLLPFYQVRRMINTNEDLIPLVRKLLTDRSTVSVQLDSYNELLSVGIHDIFKELRSISWFDRQTQEQRLVITMINPIIKRPCHRRHDVLLPRTCRQLTMSYNGGLYCDIQVIVKNKDADAVQRIEGNVYLGDIPVMLGSSACWIGSGVINRINAEEDVDDDLGYFIVNGQEKAMVTQERVTNNHAILYSTVKSFEKSHVCEIRSCVTSMKTPITFSVRLNQNTQNAMDNTHGAVYCRLSFFKSDVPLFVLLVALAGGDMHKTATLVLSAIHNTGFTYEKVCQCLEVSARETSVTLPEEAYLYISRCMTTGNSDPRTAALDAITNNVLPHLGSDTPSKLRYVTYMVGILIVYAHGGNVDDRDTYANKRLETPGILIGQQLRCSLHRMRSFVERNLAKAMVCSDRLIGACQMDHDSDLPYIVDTITQFFASHSITRSIMYAMTTGNWTLQATGNVYNSSGHQQRTGVVQLLSRYNVVTSLSHLRRVNTPLERVGKVSKPRTLHPSHYGYLCPVETPEGPSCGLIKNLALGAVVTTLGHQSHTPVVCGIVCKALQPYLVTQDDDHGTMVFLNGAIIGVVKDADNVLRVLHHLRREFHPVRAAFMSVYRNFDTHIHIHTDEGRIVRYLLCTTVEGQDILWQQSHLQDPVDQLVAMGIITYMDIGEITSQRVAVDIGTLRRASIENKRYVACEIHPYLMLGLTASLIPMIQCNQSPRNTYQTSMSKQAIAFPAMHPSQMDISTQRLMYPQIPLVRTDNNTGLEIETSSPLGENFLVAISNYSGVTQNDAVVMNMHAIQRGLGLTQHNFVIKMDIRYPESLVSLQRGPEQAPSCSNLHPETGIVRAGATVRAGDPLFYTVSVNDPHDSLPVARHAKAEEVGVVSRVEILSNSSCIWQTQQSDHYMVGSEVVTDTLAAIQRRLMETPQKAMSIRIRFSTMRHPEIGDKMASRHGQKGTIAQVLSGEDMLFCADGTVPDLIFNSHGIPSRMTIGQMWEQLLSKLRAVCPDTSTLVGGRAFSQRQNDLHTIFDGLKFLGYHAYGREKMFSGLTGQPLDGTVSLGIVYYQRLKHMVQDKMHARSMGPVTQLVRQPTDGRARAGGLRIGEMERDCLLGHGAVAFMKERLLWKSDAFQLPCCSLCGHMTGWVGGGVASSRCRVCGKTPESGRQAVVTVPYSCKLLLQEMVFTGCVPRLQLAQVGTTSVGG